MLWVGIATGLVLAAALCPLCGARLLNQLNHWRALRTRMILEDALKHLVAWKHLGRSATAESAAGVLRLAPRPLVRVITRMESDGLIERVGGELRLTAAGERWALRVVRAHRLWERYLADEAGMPLADLHRVAERAEHRLTTEELDALDAHLGYPQNDPHGDPIPSASGRVEPLRGATLNEWALDRPAQIVHIEDEPAIVFEQIVAQGLRPGQIVRVLSADALRIVLSDGKEEYRLAPLAAAKIQVAPPPSAPPPSHDDVIRLADLPNLKEAEVVRIEEACRGLTRRRLLDLGLTRGARIRPELSSPFGEPRAFRVRGTLISLRLEQAVLVFVRPYGNGDSRFSRT